MAAPVGFEGSNAVFRGYEDVRDLPVFMTSKDEPPQIISAWRLSAEELAEVNRTGGVVWLSVRGRTLAPVVVSGTSLVLYNDKPSRAEPVLPLKLFNERTL